MKLLVTVPYRNRESHLIQFIPHIKNLLLIQNIPHHIVVIEQNDDKLFNRGLLCNIGFYLYKHQSDYLCIHDVDIMGENFDYSYEPHGVHLSARWRDYNYKEFYPRCLGGVVLFPKNDFIKINGFSNQYWGWGAEDDDLRLRCDIMNIKVERKQGRFWSLPHEKIWSDKINKIPGYQKNLNKFNNFKKQSSKDLIMRDGLNRVVKYFDIIETCLTKDYTFVRIKTK